MWKLLRQAFAALPPEINWVVATQFCVVALGFMCMIAVRFAPGGVVPDALLAIVGYMAGIKLIVIVMVTTSSILLVFGLLIARIFSGIRNRP